MEPNEGSEGAVWVVQSEYVSQQEPAASVLNPQETQGRPGLWKGWSNLNVVEFAPLMRLKTLFVLALTHDLLLRGHPVPTGSCP